MAQVYLLTLLSAAVCNNKFASSKKLEFCSHKNCVGEVGETDPTM